MKRKVLFYRKLNSSLFIKSEVKRLPKFLFVKLKNEINDSSFIFCPKHKKWEKAVSVQELTAESETKEIFNAISIEYAEKPERTYLSSIFPVHFNIEDLDEEQLSEYVIFIKKQKRYDFNKTYFIDENGIKKDICFYEVITDDERLYLEIKIHKIYIESEESIFPETIKTAEEKISFNMQTGSFFSSVLKKSKYIYDSNPAIIAEQKNIQISKILLETSMPEEILSYCYKKVIDYAGKFLGIKFNSDYKIEGVSSLETMWLLTKLPAAPHLYKVITSQIFYGKGFACDRKDTEIFNRFCNKFNIKNYRYFRHVFLKNNSVLIANYALGKCKVKDINIYNRVFNNPLCGFLFDYNIISPLKFFFSHRPKMMSEKSAVNLILKNLDSEQWILRDGLRMFKSCYSHLPGQFRKDIYKYGITEFNHNALSNYIYKIENTNIEFKYTSHQLEYSDIIEGYEFCLPKDSYELHEVGASMHNCVASYASSIADKSCTIIYAKKNNEYVLCIEVRRNSVIQQLGSRNHEPAGKDAEVLAIWRKRHNLKC